MLLQHGSILVGGDQRLPGGGDQDGAVTLRELLGPVDRLEVTRATAAALRAGFGGEWTEAVYDSSELEAANRLEAVRYAQDAWTWRRRQEWT